jgi:hypothetical protein
LKSPLVPHDRRADIHEAVSADGRCLVYLTLTEQQLIVKRALRVPCERMLSPALRDCCDQSAYSTCFRD